MINTQEIIYTYIQQNRNFNYISSEYYQDLKIQTKHDHEYTLRYAVYPV